MHLPVPKIITPIKKFKSQEEGVSGIHTPAQSQIFMHIEADCMGVEYSDDTSD
jgi:hypothetical protein